MSVEMKSFAGLLIACCALSQTPYATSNEPAIDRQEIAINRGSAALWQSLKKLHTRASLVMVTAHPDDEDGGMLTYESRGVGARVALLTLNRGEGGANVMSPDFFDALGLVRTEELLAADRYYGVDQYWTRVVDYGYSKTKAESIKMWTHDRVLYDVVRVVRMVRPLVITSVFVGAPSDGHGNHQTAGVMAREVFKAAADPNVFPDQIKAGLRPWAAMKDYVRVSFARPGAEPALTANVQVPEGNYDSLLGMSYRQIARIGLGFQKSQNDGGSLPDAGEFASAYNRFASLVPAQDHEGSFFDGIDTSLLGIATLAPTGDTALLKRGLGQINSAVENAMAQFSAVHPERCAPSLAAGMKATNELLEQLTSSDLSDDAKYDIRHELEIKRAQFNNALVEALGLSITATVRPQHEPDPQMEMYFGEPDTFRIAVPGQTVRIKLHLAKQGPLAVALEKTGVNRVEPVVGHTQVWVGSEQDENSKTLGDNEPVERRFEVLVPEDALATRPYFSRPDVEQPYYDIEYEQLLNRPLAPYPLAGWAGLRYEGVTIRISEYVQTVQRVLGEGAVYQPLAVGPAISVAISPRAGIVPLDSKSFAVTTVVHSNVKGPAQGSMHLLLPEGWRSNPATATFSTSSDGQDQSLTFQVTPEHLTAKSYRITAVSDYNGRRYTEGYTLTGYPTLRPYFLYRQATYQLNGVDVKVAPGLRVGYVMGSGDDVPSSLEHLGIHVTTLGPADIATGDLSRFDVILLGVRTYATRPELITYNSRVLDYVRNGGVLIVQYNTPEFDGSYGPYPYVMGTDPEEVTDEKSKVNILEPANPIFTWPNKISEADFGGWVEERGSKWMKSWAPQYQALLETHDEDQGPQKGGLLYAKYGKGVYVYNAYAFYRQLPEGVPGAYRIFANMLSLAKNPSLGR